MNRLKIYNKLFLFLLASTLMVGWAMAQNNNLSLNGKVIDGKYKTPLAGATVHIKGTTHEVSTDLKGFFQFVTGQKVPVTYIVSFVGYETEEVLVTEAKPITITLKESANQLNDVVVIGYGTQKRKDVTGSLASVPKEALSRPSSSFDNLLQGAVAGVAVSQSSGQPGATSSIRIRGGNSLSFGNDPLYVIDGFIYYNDNSLVNLPATSGTTVSGVSSNGLSTINPSDIESIDILKDAAATAIYGSRGANGVVIITTKKGTKGSNNVNYSVSFGSQQVDKKVDVLNGKQWASLFDDLYKATPGIQAALAPNKAYIDSLAAAGFNQDWASAAIKSSTTQNHQLSIYGGDEKSRYSLSGNYYNQDGLVLGTNFKRYSARFNYEKNLNARLKFNTSIFGSNSLENKLTGSSYNDPTSYTNAFSGLYQANPLQTAYNADGSYNTTFQPILNSTTNIINTVSKTDNPLQDIASTTNQTKISRVLGNFSANYKIIEGLEFKTTFGADLLNTKLNYYAPSFTNAGNGSGKTPGYGSVANISYWSWLNENTLTYDFNINKHSINLLAGYTTQYQKTENLIATAQTFISDGTGYNNLSYGAARPAAGSGESLQTRNSWLGRANYSYAHKYNFSVSGRYDGASPLGKNNKWGFFPAVGFSWNASEEDFLKKYSNTLNSLKVRLSAGSVGNSNFPAYGSLQTLASYGYYIGTGSTGTIGLAPNSPANPDLSWETTTQYNAGVDAGFLKNKIIFTGDIYYKKTTDLYVSGGGLIPLSTGYSTVAKNIGSLENKGIELSLTTENIKNKDFSWKSTFIYATNKSTILSLGPSQSFQPTAPTGQVSPVIVKVGLPVGTFWGYSTAGLLTTADAYGANAAPKLAGVSQVTGDRKYVHGNGLTGSVINAADKHDLGSAQPKFTASFNNSLTYKQFDLSFFFQGSFGNKLFNLLEQQLEKTTPSTNVSINALDRWDSINNPNGKFQKVTNSPVMQVEDTYIEDGSYIRLKSLTLGYNFPTAIAGKVWAKQIRLYVSAQNLLTITKYKGQDPEANFYDQNNLTPGVDFGVYPRYKTFLAGLNVTF